MDDGLGFGLVRDFDVAFVLRVFRADVRARVLGTGVVFESRYDSCLSVSPTYST